MVEPISGMNNVASLSKDGGEEADKDGFCSVRTERGEGRFRYQ